SKSLRPCCTSLLLHMPAEPTRVRSILVFLDRACAAFSSRTPPAQLVEQAFSVTGQDVAAPRPRASANAHLAHFTLHHCRSTLSLAFVLDCLPLHVTWLVCAGTQA